ncbi:hypothetical protein FLONG3_11416 [Fusarium longipes]|uniref:Uncharacterized protein n=1 Tax=Fusarium longipes TaxID=694270 RepID=A0A395RF99_9HYPO|nr:hypothetical protein FLONG3_11416 [Fusarium longipes]
MVWKSSLIFFASILVTCHRFQKSFFNLSTQFMEYSIFCTEYGAFVDSVDNYGNTPLLYAQTPECVDLLLHYDASPTDILTKSLVETVYRFGQGSAGISQNSMNTAQQQLGLSSLGWLDASIPVYRFHSKNLDDFIVHELPKYQPEGHTRLFNYLSVLASDYSLCSVLQSNIQLDNVGPFPWHLYSPESFYRSSFLSKHFRMFFKRFGYESVKQWVNLEPVEGWSPLCRAASQNCTKKMENCLSLGADIEYEGCPLGSALMIASACGQLEPVKLLIRRGARVHYKGRVGYLSVLRVARSKIVRSWLLVGRFNDQQRIGDITENHSTMEMRPWSGLVQARVNLHGYQRVRHDETMFDCATRLSEYAWALRGRVAPYIDGLVFNRHEPPIRSAFATLV